MDLNSNTFTDDRQKEYGFFRIRADSFLKNTLKDF